MYTQGSLVKLKSDPSIEGAVINIIEGGSEVRYQVYVGAMGVQTYYESQLEPKEIRTKLEQVSAVQFQVGLTASLIRNPSLSSLYSLNGARIDFIPHQFRPVLKFIKADRPRILIADGVGVGKTIEAGLILREMQARQNLKSVLIICPRPLVTERKWENEMKRFDEDFTALDGDLFRYCMKEYDYEGEWPDKFKKVILPYSLFDEGNVMGGKGRGSRRKMGLIELNPSPKFDLVIVDEAHHIRNTATYAYRAVKQFCDNAEAVIFLTATPVQLEYDDLFVMLNLLRPDLIIDKETFHRMAEPNAYINLAAKYVRSMEENWKGQALEALQTACNDTEWGLMVIKGNPLMKECMDKLRKSEITQEERVKLIADIESLHTFSNLISRTRRRDIGEFTKRKATTVTVEFTSYQKQLHDEILSVLADMFSQIHQTDNIKFMMTTIRRQVASCLFGLVPMLHDILYRHMDEIYDDGYINFELFNSKDARSIQQRVEDIIRMADNLPEEDPKCDQLLRIIADKQKEKKNKVMIFSTFKHTLRYLYEKLSAAGLRVGMIHGEVDDQDRRDLRSRFEMDRENQSALDVLLFSEVGCEGLDYQFCDCMINYDLPWNPMRVEQRIGRIDRNGQTSESVAIFNMITPGTVDYDIYERCTSRIGVFRQSIGDCEEILGSVAKDIQDIVENFTMSESDRQEKLQQLADNKIRLIEEQMQLEEKQRDLFGIKVPDRGFDEELKSATNYWLSAEFVANMVQTYLKLRLEKEKDYILGEKSLKTLRVSQAARSALLEDFKTYKIPRNPETRAWEKWLQSGEQHLSITFDSACSKENPKSVLITMSHPLVKQAAMFLQKEQKTVTVFETESNLVAPGEYPFTVFQWKLSGDREDLQIKLISQDSSLNDCIFDLIKNSRPAEYVIEADERKWDNVEQVHHVLWQKELSDHKQRTQELIQYKKGSLISSHKARIAQIHEGMRKNPKMHVLYEGWKRNAIADYELHKEELEKAAERADILSETLAYGILIVKPEQ